jgi:hypothetical protein
MKKINFTQHILPHVVAISAFLIVTLFFFKPFFFDNKTLEQPDIQQATGSAKTVADYREQTGEEALWVNNMFSGMPAYMVSVEWGNKALKIMKQVLAVGISHPVSNIYLAFFCYYIMLLAFGVRPYLAIAGAIAFGLSSYMIIGVGAGHNARIGAIAFMPLVIAGIHLAFTGKRILGFGITTLGLALHLRENHLQMTYYMVIIVGVYGIIQMIEAIRQKTLPVFLKNIAFLIPAALVAAGTFFGQFWAINDYTKVSTRGRSEIAAANPATKPGDGIALGREYAFAYSQGILEPMTLLIPNFYGGSSASSLLMDRKSETFQFVQQLVNSGNEQLANQLYNYTIPYWGPQFNTSPYYAGAIVVFLFAIGIAFADRKYIVWLVPISVIGILLSWGSSFPSFNYFLFDYLPGYNKFRSVTFAFVMILFAMPLLGLLGVEKLWKTGLDKKTKRKLLIAFASTGGLSLLLILFAGIFDFTKDTEAQLPAEFVDAMISDRKGLFRADAFRSFAFISGIFILLYFDVHKKITPIGFHAFFILMVTIDLGVVDKRYFSNEAFKRKRENTFLAMTEADQEILKDKSYYRVYNLQWEEARSSYYHRSIGGYSGAKMRRYQDFYDSCISVQTRQLITDFQQRSVNLDSYHAFNMLNVKYIMYGQGRDNIIVNPAANGGAWFVRSVIKVNSPAEELKTTCSTDTKTTAVIDVSKFQVADFTADSTAAISVTDYSKPNYLKYESKSASNGLAVFSEIYYPGWTTTIDGQEVPVKRVDYLLRALEVPAGSHTIEFRFEPKAYAVGNKVTTASSWLVVIILLGSIGWHVKSSQEKVGTSS